VLSWFFVVVVREFWCEQSAVSVGSCFCGRLVMDFEDFGTRFVYVAM